MSFQRRQDCHSWEVSWLVYHSVIQRNLELESENVTSFHTWASLKCSERLEIRFDSWAGIRNPHTARTNAFKEDFWRKPTKRRLLSLNMQMGNDKNRDCDWCKVLNVWYSGQTKGNQTFTVSWCFKLIYV